VLPKSSQQVTDVMRMANDLAHEYEQEYVGTEHVLLAIAANGSSPGSRVLQNHGLTSAKLRAEVDRLIKKRLEETWVFGRLPGTPHFKNVMATAIEQCQQLEAKEVSTEHLLLALLKEKGSVAYKALHNLGLTYEKARSEVLNLGVN
jgi:ATP-dependent Clp protease ATP-binding subunit ClpA